MYPNKDCCEIRENIKTLFFEKNKTVFSILDTLAKHKNYFNKELLRNGYMTGYHCMDCKAMKKEFSESENPLKKLMYEKIIRVLKSGFCYSDVQLRFSRAIMLFA